MWDYASRALWTLSDLIGDTRVAVSAVNGFEAGVALDSDSVKRLDDVNNSLNELYDALFPPGTSESNNPWAVASYSAMDRVIGKVEALRSSVGKAWLIVPHLQELRLSSNQVSCSWRRLEKHIFRGISRILGLSIMLGSLRTG